MRPATFRVTMTPCARRSVYDCLIDEEDCTGVDPGVTVVEPGVAACPCGRRVCVRRSRHAGPHPQCRLVCQTRAGLDG